MDSRRVRTSTLMLSAVALLLFAISPAFTAGYVKFDGVVGESMDVDHPGWSDGSCDASVITHMIPSGGGPGVTTLGDFVVVKEVDTSSPVLQQACCEGTRFSMVTLEFTRRVGEGGPAPRDATYMRYELSNCIITSYSTRCAPDSASADRPTEDIAINYTKIKWTYTPYDSAGNPLPDFEGTYEIQPASAEAVAGLWLD